MLIRNLQKVRKWKRIGSCWSNSCRSWRSRRIRLRRPRVSPQSGINHSTDETSLWCGSRRVELWVSFRNVLLEKHIGIFRKTKKQIGDIKEKVVSAVPKKKEILPPLELTPLPPVLPKEPIHVDPVDVHKDVTPLAVKQSPEIVASKNKRKHRKMNLRLENLSFSELEERIKTAIHSAEGKVRLATEAKLKTINAINEHASILKQTVDDAQHANWENVTAALQRAEAEARVDSGQEVDGRNYIDNLRKVGDETDAATVSEKISSQTKQYHFHKIPTHYENVLFGFIFCQNLAISSYLKETNDYLKIVNDGKKDSATATNPLLLNALETANKLSHQLDEINGLVNKVRNNQEDESQNVFSLVKNQLSWTSTRTWLRNLVSSLLWRWRASCRTSIFMQKWVWQRKRLEKDSCIERKLKGRIQENLKRNGWREKWNCAFWGPNESRAQERVDRVRKKTPKRGTAPPRS